MIPHRRTRAWIVSTLLASILVAGSASSPAFSALACGTWSFVPTPKTPPEAALLGVDGTSATDAWAVGSFFGGLPPFIFHWDGTRWTKSPQEPYQGGEVLYDVAALSPTDAWAIGYGAGVVPLVLHWDGTIWRHVDVPIPGTFNFAYDVAATSSTDVWVVGGYDGSQGTTGLVLHWDGIDWTLIPIEQPRTGATFYGVWPAAPDDVWAVGYTTGDLPGEFAPLIEHYDGTAWNIVDFEPPPSGKNNQFYEVAGVSSNDVWAVGFYADAVARPLAEHWDGTSWSLVSMPDRGGDSNTLSSVTLSASDDVWAGGQWTPDTQEATYYPLLEHWDGFRWSQVKPAIPKGNSAIAAMAAISPDDVWAVGGYIPAHGGSLTPLIEHSDGCRTTP
jgi:hypothetical protein